MMEKWRSIVLQSPITVNNKPCYGFEDAEAESFASHIEITLGGVSRLCVPWHKIAHAIRAGVAAGPVQQQGPKGKITAVPSGKKGKN